MEVDPELQGIIKMMQDAGFPQIGSVAVDMLRQMMAAPPYPVEEVGEILSLRIPRDDSLIDARLYRPTGDCAGLIVYFHGGGWTVGDLDTVDATLRVLTNSTGCAILSVDYRLAPENPFPAAVDDAIAALRWATGKREFLAGSADAKLVVMGDSAGANLSAVAAIEARDAGAPEIALQVLIYPSTQEDIDAPFLHAFTPAVLTRNEIAWFFDQYIPASQRSDPRFAPILAASHANLPPALIVVAGQDLLAEDGRQYAAKLQAAGTPVTVREYPSAIHGFFTMPPAFRIVKQAIDDVSQHIIAALLESVDDGSDVRLP